ncbi:hypothetical protein OHU45_25590 [Streptomyces tubercidicus]|uniref:hypothetical protein n=1 Tax=Streptomyces tubercidicus TaxID=47759 RepID=UPI0030E5E0F5
MLTLFTNRFQAFQPLQGVPVRITLGGVRFKLPYSLTHSVRELAPRRDYLSKPEPEFTAAYRADLDLLGPERIAALLRQIAEKEGDHRLVLLCFEDLAKGLWCHRRTFATWWKDTTGDEVRELSPMADGGFQQGTLL